MSDGLPPLRDVVRQFGLEPRKRLGQNYLFDLNLTRRIARAAGPLAGMAVLEIGPGPGGLTRALLSEGAEKVVAVEADARFLPALQQIAAHWPGRVDIVHADALTYDVESAAPGLPLIVVANLPYNVGTDLLMRWLRTQSWPPRFSALTLMFQREVAERIVATPQDGKAYGRLSVFAAWRCACALLFDVPAAAFTPPPKVTSSVVQLVPRPEPLCCDADMLGRVTSAAFGQRRKMLRQSLKPFFADPELELAKLGIDATLRGEVLSLAQFVAIANHIAGREGHALHRTRPRDPASRARS